MNLQNQISLLNNPQEFVRLCNAVFEAEYGDDFLAIDDDRADGGNDGYVKSKELIIAAHCFKRIQNQNIDRLIKTKMVSDLKKAIELRDSGKWKVKKWWFVSNYPVAEAIGRQVQQIGQKEGIDITWRGAGYLAAVIQKADNVRAQFPNLEVSDVIKRLEEIRQKLESEAPATRVSNYKFERIAHTETELNRLIQEKPAGWEYLLFGSVLYIEKEQLSMKWHDFEMDYAPKSGAYLDDKEGLTYLFNKFSDMSSITEGAMKVFSHEMQIKAFGEPGSPGDTGRIIHMAKHTVGAYEGLIDWAADIRGVTIPSALESVYSAAACVARTPVTQFKKFLERSIEQMNQIPTYIEDKSPNKEPLNIEMLLELSVNESDINTYIKLAKKAKRKVRY